jgi:hypothetical protein
MTQIVQVAGGARRQLRIRSSHEQNPRNESSCRSSRPPVHGANGSEFRSRMSIWHRSTTGNVRLHGLDQQCIVTCPTAQPIELEPIAKGGEPPRAERLSWSFRLHTENAQQSHRDEPSRVRHETQHITTIRPQRVTRS